MKLSAAIGAAVSLAIAAAGLPTFVSPSVDNGSGVRVGPAPVPSIDRETDRHPKVSALLELESGPVALHVGFADGVTFEEAVAALDKAGASLDSASFEVGNWLQAFGDAAAVEALAADPAVVQIWPGALVPVPLNAVAAGLSRVPDVHPGGVTGYNLTGSGVVLALWDAGAARTTHQEYVGRVYVIPTEDQTVNYHAAHVCGTMIASGVVAAAKGMSPQATARSWDFYGSPITEWNTDKDNYDVGNNSWGYNAGTAYFGKYSSYSAQGDTVTQNDDVIQVKSAGNSQSGQPGGFDTMLTLSCAKNLIVIGAINDDKTMSSFSSWGPCDDGRVKPDLVANGVGLTSSAYTGDVDYVSYSGTSMSGPTVNGICGLMLQHMRNLGYGGSGYSPPASLLKAVLVQTSEDLGNAGPDYKFGWGLVDARAAADLLAADAVGWTRLKHETLSNGGSATFTFTLAAPQAVRVTLAWSDPAGAPNTGPANDPAPALVHDLNVRIVGAATAYPFVLDKSLPNDAATTGVNALDNVEQVYATLPAGPYTVIVDHAGTLAAPQKFSLASSVELSGGNADATPPAAIADLAVVGATMSTLDLQWTAPGDDGASGTATSYDLRYSPAGPIATEADYAAAASVGGLPGPAPAGTLQTKTLDGLPDNTTYWFAIKAIDEKGNWGALSNSAQGTTPQDTRPTSLTVAGPFPTPAPTFGATFNGPDATGDQYEIELGAWNSGAQPMAPVSSGQAVAGLSYGGPALEWGRTYFWRIRFRGSAGTWSLWSDEANFIDARVWSDSPTNQSSQLESIAPAGDVNGDGYADAIVGSAYWNGQATYEGRAWVYHGSATGLSATPDWSADPTDMTWGVFGMCVSTAGDVNGDGYDDVVVGAPWFSAQEDYEGRVYLYLGSPAGLASTPAWTADPTDGFNAEFGMWVAAAGDVNGDGYGDVIIGARSADGDVAGEGRAYVYLGGAGGLQATPAWTADPTDQPGSAFGEGVSSAGDVNGDGYDDVIVGASSWDGTSVGEGKAYLYLGSASGLATSPAWQSEPADTNYAYYGFSAGSAGDLNGDGFDDVVVGAFYWTGQAWYEGRAYVYYGSAMGIGATADWTYDPTDMVYGAFGSTVGSAGDLNGDGYDDLAVAACFTSIEQQYEGRVHLFFGSAAGIDMASERVIGLADQQSAYFGWWLAGVGDVDGDGFDDVGIVAEMFDDDFTDEGKAWLIYGHGAADTTPPAAVTDLAASGADLTWTAPGDDGAIGTAAAYDLRWATAPIATEAEFAAATPVAGVPAPSSAGSAEAFTVPGLTPGTTYWFALKSADEVPNWSALSNSPSGGSTKPTNLQVTDLTTPQPKFSAQHNDLEGDPADQRQIEVVGTWNDTAASALVAAGSQSPGYGYAGPALTWGTTYAWRIRFRDTTGAWSDWSDAAAFTMATPTGAMPNPAGWQMVSVPSGTSVATSAVGGAGATFWAWDETIRNYVSVTTLEPGRGYFVSAAPGSITLDDGAAVSAPFAVGPLASNDYAAPVGVETLEDQYAGWHMLGNVYNGSMNWKTIYSGGGIAGLEATYWKWDGTQYVSFNAITDTGSAGDLIPAFQAFWVHVVPLGGAGSILMQPPSTFNPTIAPATPNANAWLLQVAATSGTLKDDQNWAGVHAQAADGWDARDSSDPRPISGSYVRVFVDHPDWGALAGPYAQDVRATPYFAGEAVTWTITVEITSTPMNVTLSFPDLADMPGEWSYTLDGAPAADLTYVQTSSQQTFALTATRLVDAVGTLEIKLGPATPAPRTVAPGESPAMLQVEVSAAAEAVDVAPLPFAAEGTAGYVTMRVYADANANGALDAGETEIGAFTATTAPTYVLVVFEGVTAGEIRAALDPLLVTGVGQSSGAAVAGSGAPIVGATMTSPAAAPAATVGGGGGGGGCGFLAVRAIAGWWWWAALALYFVTVKRRTLLLRSASAPSMRPFDSAK